MFYRVALVQKSFRLFARSFHPDNVFDRQVLGRALGRVVRGQVALAWKAELKAREHETRLLQELEVIYGVLDVHNIGQMTDITDPPIHDLGLTGQIDQLRDW